MSAIEDGGPSHDVFQRRPETPPPAPPKPTINAAKAAFMEQYILNARLSGRSRDSEPGYEGEQERQRVTLAASDLYDRIQYICKVK